MRVLLDECVPRKLARELPDHEVSTVQQAGLTGTANGALLRRAAESFDVFLTVDANLEHQQNPAALALPVVVMIAPSNAIDVLRLLMPQVRELLPKIRRGHVYRVGPPKPTR